MNITVVQAPTFEPVTLQDVHRHLRLDTEGSPATHADDAMLMRHITTARMLVEKMVRRSLVQQVLRLSVSAFPQSPDMATTVQQRMFGAPRAIRLHRPPVLRVESVAYYDSANALTVVDPSLYYVTDEEVPELRFATSFAGATVYDRPDAVRVEYVTGYHPDGSPATTQEAYAANVPAPLKDAVLITVQLLYDSLAPNERDALEKMREAMLQPYRVQLAL